MGKLTRSMLKIRDLIMEFGLRKGGKNESK